MTPLLMGLIGGAGQGLETLNKQNYADDVRAQEEAKQTRMIQMQHDLKIQEDQTVSALQSQRKQEEEQRTIANAAQVRQTTTSDINAQMPGLINQNMNSRFSGSDAAVAAANDGQTDAPLTQEQQDTITQTKSDAQSQLQNSPMLRAQAANLAGYPEVGANYTTQAKNADVSVGYGGVLGQRNADGSVSTVIDNSFDRGDAAKTGAQARVIQAEAAQTRANAIANATNSTDPLLSSYGKTADRAGIVLGRTMAQYGDPTAPAVIAAQQAYDDAAQKVIDRQDAVNAANPARGPNVAAVNTAMAPSTAQPRSGAPYVEGTVLNGPGGKRFVVKNGVPVPL